LDRFYVDKERDDDLFNLVEKIESDIMGSDDDDISLRKLAKDRKIRVEYDNMKKAVGVPDT